MAEMLKHEAEVACYGRWDDQDKVWNDASLMLGAHKKAAVIADVIVDTPEEIKALPDDEEVITPVENVMGPVVTIVETPITVDTPNENGTTPSGEVVKPAEKDPAETGGGSGSGKPVPPTVNEEGND